MLELYVLDAGYLHLDRSAFTHLANIGVKIQAPVPMYLIKSDHGHVLFDTGLCGTGLEKPEEVWGTRASLVEMRPENDVRRQLELLGLSPGDIRFVVQSHLHWDHCGGLQFFRESTIVLQREEFRQAFSPAPYQFRYLDSHLAPARDLEFLLLDGDQELVPGVTALSTPGHTAGHQSLMVETDGEGPVILASDAVPTTENVERRILPTILENAAATWSSMMRLIQLAGRGGLLVPSHDPDFHAAVDKAPRPLRRSERMANGE